MAVTHSKLGRTEKDASFPCSESKSHFRCNQQLLSWTSISGASMLVKFPTPRIPDRSWAVKMSKALTRAAAVASKLPNPRTRHPPCSRPECPQSEQMLCTERGQAVAGDVCDKDTGDQGEERPSVIKKRGAAAKGKIA